jgi:DNA-binding transcriptional LysR family regulator
MTFDLREMEVFRRVMELGSVTAAAAALHVSQPAVTRMLQKAEQRLGFALFVREKRRLRPTAEAQILFPEALGTFASIHALERLADELRDGRTGILGISTIPSLASALLPDAIRRFRDRRPEASVTVQTFNSHEVIQRIAAHRDDLGIIIGPVGNQSLQVVELQSTGLSCVMPPAHPLAALRGIRPGNLQGVSLICPGRNLVLTEQVARAFAESNTPFRIAVEVSHAHAAIAMVRAGVGIALIDGFGLMGTRADDLVSRPFRPGIASTARLLTARLRPPSVLVRDFAEAMTSKG